MSLGWLTESTLLPRKAKPIQVDATSLLSFQSALHEEAQKHTPQSKAPTTKSLKQLFTRKTEIHSEPVKATEEPGLSTVEMKADLYSKLRQKSVRNDRYLVDFEYRSSSDSEAEPEKRPHLSHLLTSTEKQYFPPRQLPLVIHESQEDHSLKQLVKRRRELMKLHRIRRIQELKQSGHINSINLQ